MDTIVEILKPEHSDVHGLRLRNLKSEDYDDIRETMLMVYPHLVHGLAIIIWQCCSDSRTDRSVSKTTVTSWQWCYR